MRITASITISAIHWSCGQYTSATTGARLNPISITTAPVTTGGSTRCSTDEPRKWIATPASASTTPAIRIAPVTSEESPPCARIATTAPTKDALVPR
jgi:hypothetical protein